MKKIFGLTADRLRELADLMDTTSNEPEDKINELNEMEFVLTEEFTADQLRLIADGMDSKKIN